MLDGLIVHKVIATLIEKDDWYVFYYEGMEYPAPQKESLVGKVNETNISIYVSDNLLYCSYPNPERRGCIMGLIYNIVFILIYSIVVYVIKAAHNDLLYCIDLSLIT